MKATRWSDEKTNEGMGEMRHRFFWIVVVVVVVECCLKRVNVFCCCCCCCYNTRHFICTEDTERAEAEYTRQMEVKHIYSLAAGAVCTTMF